jgi:aryl-alcohol dehydrogenase-like predicted oxidoreductase
MKYRPLAGTGRDVSVVGFGLWSVATGWWAHVSDAQALRWIRRAAEAGINFFDTAPGYGEGRGDRLLGEAFDGRPEDIVVSAKVALHPSRPPHDSRFERGTVETLEGWALPGPPYREDQVLGQVDRTLQRLRRDFVDCLAVHNPTLRELRDGSLYQALEAARRTGRCRSWGIALGPSIGWQEEGLHALRAGARSVMSVYNLLEPEPGQTLSRACAEQGASLLARVPHASGVLDGSFDPAKPYAPSDHRSLRSRDWLLRAREACDLLRPLVGPGVRTWGQLAIQGLLEDPHVASVLPTFGSEAQIDEYSRVPDLPPLPPTSAEIFRALASRMAPAEVLSP